MVTNTTTTFPADLVTRVVVFAAATDRLPTSPMPDRNKRDDKSVAADVQGWLNEMNDFDRF